MKYPKLGLQCDRLPVLSSKGACWLEVEGEKEPEGTTGEDGDYIFFLQKMLSTEIKVKICDISEYQIYTEHNCHERAKR